MYRIIPYKSIGNFELDVTQQEIKTIAGDGMFEQNPYLNDLIVGRYAGGVNIEFVNTLTAFIGVVINNQPEYGNFLFLGKNYNEILVYFRHTQGLIYLDSTVIISETLGISCYFEDEKLLEVGIFSKAYKAKFVEGIALDNY